MKRFERSNGLDTALYKNYLYLFFYSAEQPLFICHDCNANERLNASVLKQSERGLSFNRVIMDGISLLRGI